MASIGDLKGLHIGIAGEPGKDAPPQDAWNLFGIEVDVQNAQPPHNAVTKPKLFHLHKWISPRDQTKEPVAPLPTEPAAAAAVAAPAAAPAPGVHGNVKEAKKYKDHDDVEVLTNGASWWFRRLEPVQRVPPETARETLAQVEATPAELIVDYDPDEIELKKIQKPDPELEEKMKLLKRPTWREPVKPPLNKVWKPAPANASAEDTEAQKLKEREVFTAWLRNEQAGGLTAVQKQLNKSGSYVEKRLRHFETTNQVHRWVAPAPPPPSTIATRPATVRSSLYKSERAPSAMAYSGVAAQPLPFTGGGMPAATGGGYQAANSVGSRIHAAAPPSVGAATPRPQSVR